MAKIEITNGLGAEASVTPDNELLVSTSGYPAFRTQKIQPFRQYLTDDGTASGSNDMGVDGSSTNVDFYIPSDPNNDRYITGLSIIVGYGVSGQPNQWADGTALTNGCRLFYSNTYGELDLHDVIKTNQDMFRLSLSAIPTAWEVRHVNANNDYGYFISMPLSLTMPPYGLKLDAGTTQQLVLRVRDNAGTDADTFNIIAYGFERFK